MNCTRVSTFMFGNAVSGKNFSFLDGVKGGFHEISHHQNDEKNLEQYKRINIWHMEQYASMLDRMKAIDEGGRRHRRDRPTPRQRKGHPLCNRWLSMLKRVGAPTKNFADSTGELRIG